MITTLAGSLSTHYVAPPAPPTTFVFTQFNLYPDDTLLAGLVGDVGADPWGEAAGETHHVKEGYLFGLARTGSDTRIIPTGAVSGNWYLEFELAMFSLGKPDYIQAYQNSDLGYLFNLDLSTFTLNTNSTTYGLNFVADQFLNLRFEFVGTVLTVKSNGVTLSTDSTYAFAPTGIISMDVFNCFDTLGDRSAGISYILMAEL